MKISIRELLLIIAAVFLCASAVSAQTAAGVGGQAPTSPEAASSPNGLASPNAATRVAFVQQPTSSAAGSTIFPPVTVQLKDFLLRDVAQAGVSVSLSITSGSGTLSGTTTRETNAAGLATFDDLSVDLLGSKKLKASSPGLSSATSKSFEITLGLPTRLLIRREPSQTATAGVPFSQQPELWVVDAGGNLVSTDNSTQVTASRLAGNGELQGTVQVAARKGVVSFANLSHRVAGEITILFTSGSLTPDTTATIVVKPAGAAQLAFLRHPSNTIAGAVITPPVTVSVRDAFGNDVGTSGTPVTLALSSGSGTLAGTLTRNTASGIAAFDDLSIDLAGAKRITASSGSLTSATSDAFNITAKEAKALAFVQQPSSAEAAALIAPPVTVQLRDSLGNDVPLTGVSVTLQLASGTGTLSGTTTNVTDDAGIARFNDLSVDQVGQKRLRATSGALASALSQTFTITSAREAQLAFVQQPTNTIAGQNVNPAVTVQLRDSLGNDVAKAGVSVQVAMTAGSSGTLSGTTTQLTDASGVASFGNLSVDLAGTKALTATASGLDQALSSQFTVIPAFPSKLVFTQSPGNATAGEPFPLQPAVALHDQYQNLVTGVAQGVTVAIHANAGGAGTLSGVTTVQVDTGTGSATFSGLSIDRSGTGYTLTATGSTVSMIPGAVVSSPFNIGAAPASRVRVESEPGGNGTPLGDESVSSGTSIKVYSIARDRFDNFVSNVAADEWSLLNRTGGVSDQDLVPSLDRRSATFTGAATGSAVVNVAVAGLTSVPSGIIRVVNNATATKILVETAANGAGSVVGDQSLPSGSSLTVYAIARDLNNNFVSNVAADAWGLIDGTGGVSSGDLVPSADRRSATLTGRLVGAARVRAALGNLVPTASGIITIIPGPPSIVVATAGTPQSAKVGNAFNTLMAATVTDAAGNSVGGVAVTYNAPLSGASGSFEGGVNSVLTDTAGVAVAPLFTANSVAGMYTVTANAIGTEAFAVFELTNSPRSVGRMTAVGGTPQTTRVGTTFPARFAASVQDSFGNPVGGVEVTFTAPSSGASGSFPGGETSATVTTDSVGLGIAPEFTAGSAVGRYSVAATAPGVAAPVLFSLTNTAGSAASITALMGNQQATEVKTAFSIPLSASVKDASGNVVSGVPVTFLAPGEGPSGAFPWGVTINVATDTNGVATAPLFIANTVSGTYAVIAQAQGVDVPAAFELINIPGPVSAFRIDAEDGGPIATQMAQAPFAVRIVAQDRFGNTATAFTGTADLSSSGVLSLGAGLTPPFAEGVLARHSVAIRNAGRFVLTAIRTGGAEFGKSDTFQVNNPAPSVTRLSPSSGARGESLNLTVSGSGFLQGVSTVILGNNITTYETVASDSQITVALNIGSDALEGPRTVFVINPPPGGGIVGVDSGFVVKGIIYPETYDLVNTIIFPTYQQTSEYQDTDYRIVGFPGAAEVSISQFLSGSSDQDWAAYWDNGDSSNYLIPYDGSNTFNLSPGRAFWLLHRGPLVINTEVPTVPLDSTTSVSIALHSGWNLISNPFTVPVAWSDVQAANQPGVLGPVYGFDGSFTVSNVLDPFEGSLFDNAGGLPSLVIPFKQARLLTRKPLDDGGWKVEVDLRSGDYHERLVAFGVSPGAANGRDASDWRRPRGVGSHPEVYFEHPDWGGGSVGFATDIRGVVGNLETWPLRVRALPRQPVRLAFVGVSAVPEQLRIVLLDDDRALSEDLRATPSYVFVPSTPVSRFRIAVGSESAVRELLDEALPKEFALGNNFPNPFNPSTKIPVTVPWKSSVALRVYTVLGGLVRTLYVGPLEAGRHTFEWDGTTNQGWAVSAGVYLIQMSAEGGQQFVGKMLLIK